VAGVLMVGANRLVSSKQSAPRVAVCTPCLRVVLILRAAVVSRELVLLLLLAQPEELNSCKHIDCASVIVLAVELWLERAGGSSVA
jgi:hypothetical protein